MREMNRDFKGIWIPKEVWLDPDLTLLQKALLAEIDSLDNDDNCFASNGYFANFLNTTEATISAGVAKLIKLGYIEQVSFDGRVRRLSSNLKADFKNFEGRPQKITEQPSKNLKHSNTSNNPINNSTKEILDYLNQVAQKKYRHAESSLRLIRARLKDGYSVDDLKRVIDTKVKEWKGGEMDKYIRPKTLFNATNFEGYVNEVDVPDNPNKFPNEWSKRYENTLSPDLLPLYWAHLRGLGLRPVKHHGQVYKWEAQKVSS